MTNTVTIKSPADVAAVACSIMGFTPVESLVIVGTGGGPTARVDLPDDTADLGEIMAGLAHAACHWTGGVLLVLFTRRDVLDEVTAAFRHDLPDVPLSVALRTHEGSTFVQGACPLSAMANRTDAAEAAGLDAPAQTREDMARATEAVTDADEALTLAWCSYDTGNGARAWVYYDRFIALGGDPSRDTATDLRNRLTYAVPPTTKG